MGHHEAESAEDRTRRHQLQAQAREKELEAQAKALKQEGQSQLRDWKARQAAEADTGLEDNDPRTQKEDDHRAPVGDTEAMDTTSRGVNGPAREAGTARGAGDLAGQLGELARTMQGENNFEATLATMVHAALQLIPGAVDASISVAQARRTVRCHAPSSDLPATVDQLQEKYGQGPCLDAAYEEKIVRVPDFRAEDRWPAFAPAALKAGAKSMLAFQLYTNGEDLGALNVYGADFHTFDAEAEEIGSLVAAHAAVAFADAQQIKHLNEALATRDLIGQAKGILMERFKITAQQAFVVLTTVSSGTNFKLREVAEQLATTGTLPDAKP
ncbi:GAF and ANTAR domain-containing protein [Kocuria turfanensis]|uniref:ANTAR domain-containing protein n=1 Tax=Kocuria turfanensis TaxID=388357 RepID=A0A512IHZ5_9MICC|nr:GAF and ANTAR domain-containing protein [Kocuria turfanensis]GEO97323.1 hypothetical protein KTU01_34460 [Kocuria turfanensis]